MLSEEGFPLTGQSHNRQRYVGHSHFWQRAAMVSRRQFVKTSAGAAGAVLASGLWMPTSVLAANDPMPRPIPGGVQPFGPGTEVFHVFLPGPGAEPSTITDFHGNVALANVDGTGTGTDTTTGNTTSLLFDVDMRFMQGTFIATDGNTHKGTFSFV